ncbi:hypothetical protein SAMN05421505_12730 [Sinosporangium album]|uniref:VWFA domain-containing protein n=1 Tax=Sinosporangium album TaxID=504805 RepID=A0A1G8GG73_9ACTN|nr:vWA domain-containing protein [Sinosporangium album]SDH93392.1 hypothetical protein SAMN05421505_12730 [Sinosporangium album]
MSTYSAEINRENPAYLIFLLDHSYSMTGPLAGLSQRSKAQALAKVVNDSLLELVLACKRDIDRPAREYCDVSLIGYSDEVRLLTPNPIVSVPELERTAQAIPSSGSGDGGDLSASFGWITPAAGGKTAMCAALTEAARLAGEWIARHPDALPPIVLNITDGAATDGDPRVQAAHLTNLSTTDGNVLLFNIHLSEIKGHAIFFPAKPPIVVDPNARVLFEASSTIPRQMADLADFPIEPEARGFAFNAEESQLVAFLDLGTRPVRQWV